MADYRSQIRNIYYGSTDTGAQRSPDRGAEELVKSLQSFSKSFDMGAVAYADKQKREANEEAQSLLLTRSPDTLNKELQEGKHPKLQGYYAQSVVDNNYGMYDAGQFIADLKAKEAAGEYDWKGTQSYSEWVTEQMPAIGEKSRGYKAGFNGLATEYIQTQNIKYGELQGAYEKVQKYSKLGTVLDVTDPKLLHSTMAGFQKEWYDEEGNKQTAWNNTMLSEFSEWYVTTRLEQAVTQDELVKLEEFLTQKRIGKNGEILPSLAETRHPWVSKAVGDIRTQKGVIATTNLKILENSQKVMLLEHQLNWSTYDDEQKKDALASIQLIFGSKAANDFRNNFDADIGSAEEVTNVKTLIKNRAFPSQAALQDYFLTTATGLNGAQQTQLLKEFDTLYKASTLLEIPTVSEFKERISKIIRESHTRNMFGSGFARGAENVAKFEDDLFAVIENLYYSDDEGTLKGRGPTDREIRKALKDFQKEILGDKLYMGEQLDDTATSRLNLNKFFKRNQEGETTSSKGEGDGNDAAKVNLDAAIGNIIRDNPNTTVNELVESLTGFVTAAGIDIVDGTVANSEGVIKLTEIMANDELINSIVTASGLPRAVIIDELNKLLETN
tara:strand:- start:220 stop:2058 length:1839 start_codon:yes stop_codon:yes gene_type:complete